MSKFLTRISALFLFLIGLAGCTSNQDSLMHPNARVDDFGVPMVFVPGGEFLMGIDEERVEMDGNENAVPMHTVVLHDYYIDQYETTNAEYQACIDDGTCLSLVRKDKAVQDLYINTDEFDTSPVMYLTWFNAKTYCEWRGARLPTEAEWEKAARGIDGRSYPWGEETDCTYANYGLRSENGTACFEGLILPVGSYPKGVSPYGVYDMAGNVSEWVQDCYVENFYAQLADGVVDPVATGDDRCTRIRRGGAAGNSSIYIRTYTRKPVSYGDTSYWAGVRCVWSP